MLLPHNPYILPQHYKRYVCRPFCSFKQSFVWIIRVQYATDNLSGQQLEFAS